MSVYFLKAEGRIKIGFSDTVEQRVATILRSYSNGEFLGCMPGDRSVERFFHQKFAEDRLFGEWFRPSDELLKLIEALTLSSAIEDPRTYKTDTIRMRLDDKFCEDSSDCLHAYVSAASDFESGLAAAARWSGIDLPRLREIHEGSATIVTSAEYTICRALGEATGLPEIASVTL